MLIFVQRFSIYALLAVMLLQLSGCGFHLRGLGSTGALPFKSAQIQADSNVREELVLALKRQLNSVQVEVLDNQTAEVQILLMPTQYQASRTSTRLGDATSQLLKMTQSFQVINLTSGEKIISGSSEVYRDRQINTAVALASDNELRTIQKSMSEELARQILDRVARALRNADKVTSKAKE
ncbi:hypothetical protein THMIRHAM_18060 [Thiomicrorhabdus immobilis]|uniref:LPS-assembly lipoprotein LptE n=1 Tax=Thiomicrorhabdus immobilis TaxID=2791037 RepID=A0ABM7MF08_9GAMM|nr:LPS assembly lipoprotein LptE [Thiomicrorhabdus immobilis]BCN94021.1 hypothetical protein THMIRHAM_18060 [Thiomicrorhabdus immobilis]